MTHLALEEDDELRQTIKELKLDKQKLQQELDRQIDDKLLNLLHNNELQNLIRNRVEFQKIDITGAVFSVLSLILGIFIGMVLF
jgi:hypothetical protein